MSAEDKLRELAERCGWTDDVLQEVLTVLATECNVAFDHGQRVERGAWERRGLEADAARYRWLKAQKGLSLHSVLEGSGKWLRADGSTYAPSHTLAADGVLYATT